MPEDDPWLVARLRAIPRIARAQRLLDAAVASAAASPSPWPQAVRRTVQPVWFARYEEAYGEADPFRAIYRWQVEEDRMLRHPPETTSDAEYRIIAHSSAMGAYNAGRYDFAAVKYPRATKIWISTTDKRTREDHMEARHQRQPIGQPFLVGGFFADFPGDPALPAEQSWNCRCTLHIVDRNPFTWDG